FTEGVGIFHQKSVPRTPQQNGVVERRNRTLVEAARTMMIFSKAPMFLWAEAIATAHPSETMVFHNEDGNPARANIKQALGRPHKGVKASANSDVMYFFTSAQDGNPVQDDVRLYLSDDLKKAQDHNDGGENPTMEQVRKRAKWDNDDYVCRGLIRNGMSDSLFDIYQNVDTSKELWDTLEAKYMVEDASSKKFLAMVLSSSKSLDTAYSSRMIRCIDVRSVD
ncbi:zinc finger, CCHC-type containing protein, partial [Tanacetum coccineum]